MEEQVKINSPQLFIDITEFGKMPNSNRNGQDLRFGQWFCNKYYIRNDQRLFYTESFSDCYVMIRENYLDNGGKKDGTD